jgi:hypothetical protein
MAAETQIDLTLSNDRISRVYLMDNMDFMQQVPDKFFELAVVIPKYLIIFV